MYIYIYIYMVCRVDRTPLPPQICCTYFGTHVCGYERADILLKPEQWDWMSNTFIIRPPGSAAATVRTVEVLCSYS